MKIIRGEQTKKLEADGIRKGKVIIYDEAGNEEECPTKEFKIDKTPPQVTITSGPSGATCSGKRAITTTYKVTDSGSGINVVKDYYGYSEKYDSTSWLNRNVTSGSKQFEYTHKWGPSCTSKGTPSRGKCYKLKFHVEDVAGNVDEIMFDDCYTY